MALSKILLANFRMAWSAPEGNFCRTVRVNINNGSEWMDTIVCGLLPASPGARDITRKTIGVFPIAGRFASE
jgi:hypothetical protein